VDNDVVELRWLDQSTLSPHGKGHLLPFGRRLLADLPGRIDVALLLDGINKVGN
jgi:hypothetical protein